MAQQVPRPADPAFAEKFAYLAAGDGFAAQFHLGIDFDLETHLASEFGEHVHISRGLVSEMKVVAFVHFAGVELLLQNFFRKLPRRHQRKIASEGQQQDCVQAAGLEQAEFFRSRGDQFEPGVWPQDADGMGLEGDCHRLGALLPRAAHDLLQHVAVGAMHAVKVPDAHQRRAEAGGNILEFVEDLHQKLSF